MPHDFGTERAARSRTVNVLGARLTEGWGATGASRKENRCGPRSSRTPCRFSRVPGDASWPHARSMNTSCRSRPEGAGISASGTITEALLGDGHGSAPLRGPLRRHRPRLHSRHPGHRRLWRGGGFAEGAPLGVPVGGLEQVLQARRGCVHVELGQEPRSRGLGQSRAQVGVSGQLGHPRG